MSVFLQSGVPNSRLSTPTARRHHKIHAGCRSWSPSVNPRRKELHPFRSDAAQAGRGFGRIYTRRYFCFKPQLHVYECYFVLIVFLDYNWLIIGDSYSIVKLDGQPGKGVSLRSRADLFLSHVFEGRGIKLRGSVALLS